MWTNGFTPLGNHSAFLPAATTDTWYQAANQHFHYYPFFKAYTYDWAVRGFGFRWECDDYVENSLRSTRHNVYVRNGPMP